MNELGPLPWDEINSCDAADVLRVLGVDPAPKEKRKYPCINCGSSDALHAYPGGDHTGLHCYSCNSSWSNVDAAAHVLKIKPADALKHLAGALGVFVPERPTNGRHDPHEDCSPVQFNGELPEWGKPVESYPYHSQDGTLLHAVLRYEANGEKTFRQIHRHEREGPWYWGTRPPMLYRLTEVFAETDTVWIVEGEKDADALRAEGLTATTWAGGAWKSDNGKWGDSFTLQVAHAHVVVLADFDEPGINTGRHIANQLLEAGVDVTHIERLDTTGTDVSDWLDDGHDAAELVEIAERTGRLEPPEDPDVVAFREKIAARIKPMILDQRRPTPEWLVPDLLLHPELTMFFGHGGAGKSTIVYHIVAALAGGYPLFDRVTFTPSKPQRILMFGAEDSAGIMEDRVRAFAHGHQWDLNRIMPNLVIWDGQTPVLDNDKGRLEVITAAEVANANRVVFDPLTNFIGSLDENASGDMGQLVTLFRQLIANGVSVDLVHHGRKGQPNAQKDEQAGEELDTKLAHEARGSGHLVNSARLVYMVSGTRERVTFNCVKGNLAKRRKVALNRSIQEDPDPRSTAWDSAALTWLEADDVTGERAVLLDLISTTPGLNATKLKEAYLLAGGRSKLYTDARQELLTEGLIEMREERSKNGRSQRLFYLAGSIL